MGRGDIPSGTAATASLLVGAFAGNVAEFTAVVAREGDQIGKKRQRYQALLLKRKWIETLKGMNILATSESAANRSVATVDEGKIRDEKGIPRASSGLALLLRIVVLIGLGRAISGEMSVTVAVVALNLSLVYAPEG